MGKSIFKINKEKLFEAQSFVSASAEELRVLVAIIGANVTDEKELASLAFVSEARCRAAISLFEAEGIITKESVVTDEFESVMPQTDDGVEDDSAKKVAKDIRDSGLASLITDIAMVMEKPALSTTSVKKIISLYTNYALNEEYILTLAAYLSDTGRLTVTRLVNEAIKLVDMEIDTPNVLFNYLEEKKKKSAAEARVSKLLIAGGRPLTKTERECFNKWVNEFGFSESIIEEAYDITVANTGRYSLKYIDEILTRWHESGCETVSECLAASERDRKIIRAKRSDGTGKAPKEKKEGKYAAFSAEDALMRALERSYGTDEN